MLYSKTTRYAVVALSEIARREEERAVSTKSIAQCTDVPYPLLAKIILRLKAAGLVVAKRGKNGGVRLAHPAASVKILDVVLALDGEGILSDCPLHLAPCACERECDLHPIWKPARDAVIRFLETTSILDVANARAQLPGA